jgi:hypothetical protein
MVENNPGLYSCDSATYKALRPLLCVLWMTPHKAQREQSGRGLLNRSHVFDSSIGTRVLQVKANEMHYHISWNVYSQYDYNPWSALDSYTGRASSINK